MTEQELLAAAATFKYSRGLMLWALEEQKPGECGYLGGCHDPADPDSPAGYCSRHETYQAAHAPKAVPA